MSNSSRHRPAPNRGPQHAKSSQIDQMVTGSTSSSARKFPWIWVIVGLLVVAAGGIAVLSSGGDEEVTVGTAAPDGESSSPGEVQPVSITGDPLAPFAETAGDAAIGMQAPTLVGFSFDGQPVRIEPTGSPTMVVFLAHWCPHCNNEIPVLNEWREAGLVPDGLEVVGVSTSVVPSRDFYPPSKWLDDKGWEWATMADSELSDAATAFGLTALPGIMILDGEGKVLGRASGEMGLVALQAFVDDALAGNIA